MQMLVLVHQVAALVLQAVHQVQALAAAQAQAVVQGLLEVHAYF